MTFEGHHHASMQEQYLHATQHATQRVLACKQSQAVCIASCILSLLLGICLLEVGQDQLVGRLSGSKTK